MLLEHTSHVRTDHNIQTTMITESELYQIGHITRTHGVKGEVSMTFTDDVWDRADADYVFLQLDGIFVPFFFEEWRFRSDTVCLLKFVDIDSVEQAQELCGATVWFPHSLTPEVSGEEEFTWQHFTGFSLVDATKGNIGTIGHVDTSTPNVLFEVGEHLIPAAEPLVEHIDHKARTIYMNLPEGLL